MPAQWDRHAVLELIRAYQPAAVVMAAAELDLFAALADTPATAPELAARLSLDARAATVLLDALAAIGFLDKHGERYATPTNIRELLTADGSQSVLGMVQHQANCLRRWMQLAAVVQRGTPAERIPSVRGEAGDQASFIAAMNDINQPHAGQLVRELDLPQFTHVLDVGGASGTWTLALLDREPAARATIFDLPHVTPMAETRLSAAGVRDRVTLVAGDFDVDELPRGADLAWVSAIAHQYSREQNRAFFRKVFDALQPGGTIVVRDIVMDDSHTQPVAGALFAINMLVATPGGGTYSLEEYTADLQAAGFVDVRQLRHSDWMDAFLSARRT